MQSARNMPLFLRDPPHDKEKSLRHNHQIKKGETDMEQYSKHQTPQKQNHCKRYPQKYNMVSRQFVGSPITYIHFTHWVTVKDELYRKVQGYFSLLFRKILIFFQRVRCDSLFCHAKITCN